MVVHYEPSDGVSCCCSGRGRRGAAVRPLEGVSGGNIQYGSGALQGWGRPVERGCGIGVGGGRRSAEVVDW